MWVGHFRVCLTLQSFLCSVWTQYKRLILQDNMKILGTLTTWQAFQQGTEHFWPGPISSKKQGPEWSHLNSFAVSGKLKSKTKEIPWSSNIRLQLQEWKQHDNSVWKYNHHLRLCSTSPISDPTDQSPYIWFCLQSYYELFFLNLALKQAWKLVTYCPCSAVPP